MRPCCPRPPSLLVLVLCWLLARPALGLPVPLRPGGSGAPPRDLEESASGDDLISGTDFLSVFIGANNPPPRQGRARPLALGASAARSQVGEEPEQHLGAFGARLIPKDKPKSGGGGTHPYPYAPPPSAPTPPSQPQPHPSHTDQQVRFQDLSNSKVPSSQVVSFDPTIDQNPLPEASARIAQRAEPHMDLQIESLTKSSADDETTGLDSSEFNSEIPTEDTSTYSDSVATTSRDDLLDLALSDVEQEEAPEKPDVTIITEVVTSREEKATEPTNAVSSQESQEHEAQASISHQRAVAAAAGPREHPAKAAVDDSQNAVAVTAPNVVERSVGASPDGASGDADAAPPPPLPPPPPVQQVVSVRVSSSVVQGPSPAPPASSAAARGREASSSVPKQDGLAQTPATPASEEEMQRQFDQAEASNALAADAGVATPATPAAAPEPPQAPPSPALVTEDQPTNIAVQRSEFSVEEAAPSSSELAPRRDDPAFHKTVARVVEVSRNSQSAPVSYQTSVSSATSGSRVQFYSEPPSYHRELPSNVAESIRTSVVTSHQHVRGSSRPKYEHVSGGPMGGSSEEVIESRMGRYGTPHHEVRISGPHERVSYSSEVRSSQELAPAREQKSFRPSQNPERNYEAAERNYAQTERNYAQPERTYSLPEQNYEVDEAVSVMSNGRTHGVQPTTPSPAPPAPPPTHAGPTVERAPGVLDTAQGRDPNHKFGYVVEGRNFRKYRVEERTPDGFIVGEYGVVSHDDGTLRGVRYTADGTINPQLIYEALVKFLSL